MRSILPALSRRRALLAAAGLWLSATFGAAHAAEPLPVVASFSILGDIVREVGGADVRLDILVGPDGDAHEYEPTPGDAKKLAAAKVLFVNGLDFEAWLPRLVKASGFNGATVVASRGVTPRKFAGHGDKEHGHGADHHDHDHGHAHGADDGHHHHGDADPHAWQNLANGVIYARNVAEGLAAADPAHADAYRKRADAYVARLQAADAAARKTFAAIAAERRKVVTSHDAFGYFGDAYGVDFIAAMGISTAAEPSAGDVARIIEQVKRDKVPAVFVENITSPRLVQQIARETGAKVGGTLYSDALSKPGQPGATYLEMFEWNVRQLAAALQP
ncbi:metal ABC transporter substrate-binding protein [Achromobacter ruhlandii]|uniref:Manganese ABC transporter substrate-binding lipoprotein n=1 Tax=Achromobacter ruhlandii TaxID=72557 RepID=A0ABM8LS96_9BURK|nr:metal ABC transporter substrate-binding protein [Achromobacter ruhlandii]AKP92583.1 Zinc ABC transporter, periplasmic-binding protein ZnuA [Achromobacter xylosoxidans]AOU96427.1 zinc ABC transporter periplasmic-binding protein ZnuA [Achromobacter ruhlandii]MCZ8432153.1 metal ABC transporter substrate-binding protein [Achromobacter ruhlandii]MDC6088777.1 metal ABC transporter substrate-binding protein [Achromobacter ruhlandii]MDC6151271.1 metal ABC transporter substrate-binding protein [Achr